MNIQSTNPVSALAASVPAAPKSPALPVSGAAPTESMFLQLLVAQLKHQDPSTPSDPTQFVGELAQFSQLEQTIQIRQDADSLTKLLSPAPTSNPPVNPAGK